MKPLVIEDKALFCRLYSDAAVMEHIGPPLTMKAAADYFDKVLSVSGELAQGLLLWSIRPKEKQSEIGIYGLTQSKENDLYWDLGTLIETREQNSGYATEAMSALIEHAFSMLPLQVITGTIPQHNLSCQSVVKKLGFIQVVGKANQNIQKWELTPSSFQPVP